MQRKRPGKICRGGHFRRPGRCAPAPGWPAFYSL